MVRVRRINDKRPEGTRQTGTATIIIKGYPKECWRKRVSAMMLTGPTVS
jgi:hypothetical protein